MDSPVKLSAVGHSLLPGACLAISCGRLAWPGSGRPVAAGSSLVLAAAVELEGWLLLQQCLSAHGKGGRVWSDGPAKLLLSQVCRHACGSGNGC